MTSKIKVDNINKVSDDSNIINKCGTNITMGQNGDTVIIPNGVTEQVQSGGAIQVQSGGSITIASGATITNNGTQTGFGREGTVNWITTPYVTGDSPVTGESGKGYFMNTTAGAITLNLPAGVAGGIVSVADYAGTFQNNALTISPNGSDKIGGTALDVQLKTEGQSATLVFVDAVQGWVTTAESNQNIFGNAFICASVSGCGNTLATAPDCGNMKIATFTGPGSFIVNAAAICAADSVVSHLIIGGGGGGGSRGTSTNAAAGGGAGGYREVKSPTSPYTASPLDGYPSSPNRVTVTAQTYPIVVDGGGAGGVCGPNGGGTCGGVSSFGGIVSAGGGGGGSGCGNSGGSGGGAGGGASNRSGGAGNTPPTTPSQGQPGGGSPTSLPDHAAGGGGGALCAGQTAPSPTNPGEGGAGTSTSITGSSVAYAGGGGASGSPSGGSPSCGSPCGTGGNGGGPGTPGTEGRGAGGGGSRPGTGGNGSSGIVIIRYKFQ